MGVVLEVHKPYFSLNNILPNQLGMLQHVASLMGAVFGVY